MNRNILSSLVVGVLAVGGLLAAGFVKEVPGRQLSADLSGYDATGSVSQDPTLLWTLFIIFIVAVLGYGVYYFFIRKKEEN
jgi:hypothetical protein